MDRFSLSFSADVSDLSFLSFGHSNDTCVHLLDVVCLYHVGSLLEQTIEA